MRLSTKGRYAVMAMADLAGNAADGQTTGGETRPVALADIAARQDISLSYLEQLFAKLRRGGLVTSVRGPGGGYRLSRPSGELRIADIILAVDEPIAATRCKPGSTKGCTKTGARCVTHDLWEELGQQIHVFLSSVSLADVVERRVLGRAKPCNDMGAAGSEMNNEMNAVLDSETAAA
jgi:Rrf2 family iron-sulfur cluster assembly transcriptional regulator